MKHLIYCLTASFAIILILSACNEIETVSHNSRQIAGMQNSFLSQDINVSRVEANNIADLFYRSNYGSGFVPTKSEDGRSNLVSTFETIREDGQDLMYVFNYEDGGFVIVGATRNYYPILASSDKGSFELQDDMGPVDVWLDETKISIKNSSSLDDEIKDQMQNLWAKYDGTNLDSAKQLLSARRPQTRSTGEDACWERIDSLQALYGSEGWTFLPLSFVEQLFEDAGLSSYYSDICYSAIQNHSALNETVIGYKYPVVNQVGPLLNTEWNQYSPYNNLCDNHYPAGCTVIAAAQIMKYYAYPNNLSWGNDLFTWSDVPDVPTTTSKHPQLIRMIGQKFNISYNLGESSTSFGDVLNGLDSMGFITSYHSHDASTVIDTVYYYHKPVMMSGSLTDDPDTTGHTWVCDGVREISYYAVRFYTENQPYGIGNFTQGMFSYNNPGTVGGTNFFYTFHMNWGLRKGPYYPDYDGWYESNNFIYDPIKYHYLRYNIYISVP